MHGAYDNWQPHSLGGHVVLCKSNHAGYRPPKGRQDQHISPKRPHREEVAELLLVRAVSLGRPIVMWLTEHFALHIAGNFHLGTYYKLACCS